MADGRLLLERDGQLARLGGTMAGAAGGQGGLVFVGGEAGIGKTTLVRRFVSGVGHTPGFTGTCDPLPTPLALGPLLDMAAALGPGFARLLDGTRSGRDLFARVVAELGALGHPVVLVFEDVHWAAQATLELIGFLARRGGRLPGPGTVTSPAAEAQPGRALARLLGERATAPGVTRMNL